ncbi:MAG TPA: WG repeat-containing protein, partial [Saprospiraceae bacterium]|nr:WG repeat-containing protein [Saprospiraceae bacterium]
GKTYEYITPECLTGKPDTIIKNHMNYGYINRNGEIIVPMKYQNTSSYTDNLVVVTKGFNIGEKETFILDKVGNIVLSTPYDNLYQLEQFDESLYYVATLEKKLGLINLKGKVILPFEYKWIYGFHKLDILCVEDFGNSCHLINLSNKILCTAKQYRNEIINSNCIELPNKKFLIFPDGKSVIIDLEGNVLYSFPEQNVQLTKLDKIDVIEVIGENYKYYINAQTLKAYKN